jgi:hypothetical protein
MMCAAVNYAADKSRIRSELMKLAHVGERGEDGDPACRGVARDAANDERQIAEPDQFVELSPQPRILCREIRIRRAS